jgi:hypothetical protein
MEYGKIKGTVSIDRDEQGALFTSRDHIVISDSANDVVCLVPYEPDGGGCAEQEQLAEEIVSRLNMSHDTTLRDTLTAILAELDGACAHDNGTDPDCYICRAYRLAADAVLAEHRAADPHCTCNDCIDWIARQDQADPLVGAFVGTPTPDTQLVQADAAKERDSEPCPVTSPDGYECDGERGHDGTHFTDLEPEDDCDDGHREWSDEAEV